MRNARGSARSHPQRDADGAALHRRPGRQSRRAAHRAARSAGRRPAGRQHRDRRRRGDRRRRPRRRARARRRLCRARRVARQPAARSAPLQQRLAAAGRARAEQQFDLSTGTPARLRNWFATSSEPRSAAGPRFTRDAIASPTCAPMPASRRTAARVPRCTSAPWRQAFASLGTKLDVFMARAGDVAGVCPAPRPHRADPARAGHRRRSAAAWPRRSALLQALTAAGPHTAVYERLSLFGLAGLAHARRCGIPFVVEVNAPLWREAAACSATCSLPAAAQRRLPRRAARQPTRVFAVSPPHSLSNSRPLASRKNASKCSATAPTSHSSAARGPETSRRPCAAGRRCCSSVR
jgi:hypothetical protein